VHDIRQVDCARLEVGGALTFTMMEPTADERRFTDLTARLERMEGILNKLAGSAPAA
jgi:hypothetical protein